MRLDEVKPAEKQVLQL
jgi:hypothetical protein